MPPIDLLTDRMLLPTDRLIAAILAGYAGADYHCWPTNGQIARDVGCDPRTVYSALRRLQALGWITIEPAPGRTIRGQMIRLNWTRKAPEQRAPGRKPVRGGSETSFRGGEKPVSDRIREGKESSSDVGSRPEETGEVEIAFMRDVAAQPGHPLHRWGLAELARLEKTEAGSLAKDTPASSASEVRETPSDKPDSTAKPEEKSRSKHRMKHKRH